MAKALRFGPLKIPRKLRRNILFNGLAEALAPRQRVQIPDPADPAKTVEAFAHVYAKGAGEWTDEPLLARVADEFLGNLPGRFSGEMRAVVQDHLSRALKIPYAYGWGRTHGIWAAADGTRWIVEINAFGVYAWPLKTHAPDPNLGALASLDYIPSPTPRPQSGVVQLADAAEVAPAYQNTPMFGACGWAFSADGHLAANVAWRWDGAYKRATLYTLEIPEGVDSGPQLARLTEGESGYLWGNSVAHPKFPDYTAGSLLSFDMFYKQPTAPAASFTAPVYCWYEGSQLQVVRYHYDAGTPFNDDNPAPGGTAEPYDAWFGTIWGTRSGANGIMRCFTSPAIDGPTTGQYWSGTTTEYSDWPGARGIGPIGGFGDWARIVGVRRRNRGGRSYDDSPGDVLVVPFNDREAVFHYRGHTITDSSSTQDDTILWAEDGDTYALPDPAPVCSQVAADSGCTRRGAVNGSQNFGFLDEGQSKKLWEGPSPAPVPPGNVCDGYNWFCPGYAHGPYGDTTHEDNVETVTRTHQVAAYVAGQSRSLPAGDAAGKAWGAVIDDPRMRYQIVHAVPDASDTVDAIYSLYPAPDFGTIGGTSTGLADYPIVELTKTLTAWLGNP